MSGGGDTVAVTVVVPPARQPGQPEHHVGQPVPHHPSHLPFTGSPLDTLTSIGALALIAGAVFSTAFRRRASRPIPWGTT